MDYLTVKEGFSSSYTKWPGARFSKDPITYRARKVILKHYDPLAMKTRSFNMFQIKEKISAKFQSTKRVPIEDTKRFLLPENRLKVEVSIVVFTRVIKDLTIGHLRDGVFLYYQDPAECFVKMLSYSNLSSSWG